MIGVPCAGINNGRVPRLPGNTYNDANVIWDVRATNITLKKRRLNSSLIEKSPIDSIDSSNNIQRRCEEDEL
jgi:hypothetical protein